MLLESLSLTNFKNIPSASLEFSPKVNCLLGDNGAGKSNLLDALYFMSFCKSFSGLADSSLIMRGETFATLRGVYRRKGLDEELTAGLTAGRRKSFRRGGKEYRRLGEHIGAFPLVMLSPADMNLVNGPSEERRRFIDQIISQNDPRYLEALVRYNQALDQRNRMLREDRGTSDRALFEAVEMQMSMSGDYLTRCRRAHLGRLDGIFRRYYAAVSGAGEDVGIAYRSQMLDEGAASLSEMFDRFRHRDTLLRHTSAGPHRDDIEMTLDSMPVRRAASQGQTKTFTSALRFAQYELLRESLGLNPLLLLDDIFDKLDAGRVARIMQLVASPSASCFGQIFITDTNRKHLDEIVADLPGADGSRLWNVNGGHFTLI